jgi:co-chaperonin GroES (HSP10)
VHIGNVEAIPKEGTTMTKLTTRFMIATAALVVAVGAASAQTMTASIPFEFRVGSQVMAPGTYQLNSLDIRSGTKVFRLLDVHLRRSILVLPQAQVDPRKGWSADRNAKLVFECISGRCALAQLWSGSESYAYTFQRPKPGKDEEAYLRVIPMQRDKGE